MSTAVSFSPVFQDAAAPGRSVEPAAPRAGEAFRALFDASVAKPDEARTAKRGPTLVAPRTTKLSGTEAKDALNKAWRNVFGEEPSEPTSQVLLAQWSLETGRGKAMMNYNFGGIKGTGPSGLQARYGTHEVEAGKTVAITDGFRAYESPEEGATDYLRLLSRRYGTALEAARQGDPQGFVRGLKQKGYFTASEAQYAGAITSLTRRAAALGPEALGDVGPGALASTPTRSDTPNGTVRIGMQPATTRPRVLVGSLPPSAYGFAVDRLRGDAVLDELTESALSIARGPREQHDPGRRDFDGVFDWRF